LQWTDPPSRESYYIHKAGFEVLAAVVMKNSLFWDIKLCSPLKFNQEPASSCFLLGLFFDPENGWDMFLRNVGWLSTDYTASYPRRYNSS
jgi:hypothetical protein